MRVTFGAVICSGFLLAALLGATPSRAIEPKQLRERAEQSTVFISFEASNPDTGEVGSYFGSGFVVSSRGYVLTAHHVIEPFQAQTDAEKAKGRIFGKIGSIHGKDALELEMVASLVDFDVALLRFRRPGEYETVDFCYPTEHELIGRKITAFGFPAGQELNASEGSVVNLDSPGGRITANITLERGTSGGPVYDSENGVVLGVVKGGLEDLDTKRAFETVRYVTPIARAKSLLLGIDSEENCDAATYVTGNPWERKDVFRDWAHTGTLEHDWRDISWLPNGELWLAGVKSWGGAGGPVGEGKLLRSINDGVTWTDVTETVDSGNGRFIFGSFPYDWHQVGPIQYVEFTARPGAAGAESVTWEGTLAAATGVYRAEYMPFGLDNVRSRTVRWKRMTPPPDADYHFTLFNHLAFVEHEIYAVGWSGIVHASGRGSVWDLQKSTMEYDLRAVSAAGSPANRSVWAGGRSIDDRIVLYHLSNGVWTPVSLDADKRNRAVRDIIQLGAGEVVIAVGERGLILRSDRRDRGQEQWDIIYSATVENLNSIAYDESSRLLWAVGDNGIILWSGNQGRKWRVLRGSGKPISSSLNRVRFFGKRGFIVGNSIVLEYK